MTVVVTAVLVVFAANALISFCIVFFWQVKVILTIYRISSWKHAFVPWRALGNPNGPQNTFGRFIAGEILPQLRRKWVKAWAYVVASFAALFIVAGLLKAFAPGYLP